MVELYFTVLVLKVKLKSLHGYPLIFPDFV